MTEFHSISGPCPPIPDDLTMAQFMLDTQHPTRPVRPLGVPWFVEDATGREIGGEEVSRHLIYRDKEFICIVLTLGSCKSVCFSKRSQDEMEYR